MELVEGKLQIKDQAREYIDRGDALDSWSYLDYFLGTYDGLVVKEREHRRGRNPNTRVPYQEGANRDGHCRIIKSAGHETMPYFPGEWFPKKLEDDHNGLFEAYMLAVMSLQGHTARRERKVSVGSRESVVQWCDGSEEVSTTKYRQRMRGIQWIAR